MTNASAGRSMAIASTAGSSEAPPRKRPAQTDSAPGQSVDIALKVRNLASTAARYRFRVESDAGWQVSAPSELSVDGGDTMDAIVSVQVPPDEAEGDHAVIRVFAEDVSVAGVRNNVSAYVLVGPVNQPPECSDARPDPTRLWPPNGLMVPIRLTGVSDADGDEIAFSVTQITQDEPVVGPGAGQGAPDGEGIGTAEARVRAERNGNGDGRVYEIRFIAADGNGGECSGSVQVGVPHNQGRDAIDSGQEYDSTQL